MYKEQHSQPLLDVLREQKEMKMKGSIYHKTHMEINAVKSRCITSSAVSIIVQDLL